MAETTAGRCMLCDHTFNKEEMTDHLKSCKEKMNDPKGPSKKTKLIHIVAEGTYRPQYWLNLEIPVNATLEDLDNFLRAIWLECCGHFSAFTIQGTRYSVSPMPELDEKDMQVKLEKLLKPGEEFAHEYDFGTPTHLTLKVISEGEDKMGKGELVRLLARNEPPRIPCNLCGKEATQICTECMWEDRGWLCEKCADKHEEHWDMFLPVVNSPRVGQCGYTG